MWRRKWNDLAPQNITYDQPNTTIHFLSTKPPKGCFWVDFMYPKETNKKHPTLDARCSAGAAGAWVSKVPGRSVASTLCKQMPSGGWEMSFVGLFLLVVALGLYFMIFYVFLNIFLVAPFGCHVELELILLIGFLVFFGSSSYKLISKRSEPTQKSLPMPSFPPHTKSADPNKKPPAACPVFSNAPPLPRPAPPVSRMASRFRKSAPPMEGKLFLSLAVAGRETWEWGWDKYRENNTDQSFPTIQSQRNLNKFNVQTWKPILWAPFRLRINKNH